nr:putative transposon protein [Tanacetum cinerariifolium]
MLAAKKRVRAPTKKKEIWNLATGPVWFTLEAVIILQEPIKRHEECQDQLCSYLDWDNHSWKDFDEKNPEFATDPRNVCLALASDGFNPFKIMNVSYSIWLAIVIPYNLPPWYVMKQPNFILSLIIPGPKAPGNKIDVYMKPLIKELKDLMGKRIRIVSTKEVVQPAESTNQGQNISSDASDESSDPSIDKSILQGAKKRVRGPTKKKEIWNLASDEKVLVTFNELCQPIGDEGNELSCRSVWVMGQVSCGSNEYWVKQVIL